MNTILYVLDFSIFLLVWFQIVSLGKLVMEEFGMAWGVVWVMCAVYIWMDIHLWLNIWQP